ncbi:MAG: aromatic ring-hydroxylating dioxygenase subunit alpha [Plectolyngbya sp. WJT66-NPBG17]|jgi:phenylpropionate dioxygenase-like ring-hydroxylating dioxygenase large terminal subunit|nr:aromatic ring-hydroxylating dioxygenase subunit alpha [Plectolyngbya sp. WJT66-NPBG17]
MNTELRQDLLAASPSSFFGASLYCQPALIPIEQKFLFERVWLYVGDAENLFQTGNVFVTTISEMSILLIRDKQGNLSAFHNVCPHRASLLCSSPGSHSIPHLVCPYHGWVYSLLGELLGTPREERFPEEFSFKDFSLMPVRVEQWQGFIFVCFDVAAPPLLDYLGSITTNLVGYRTSATCQIVQKSYTVPCNWKVYHDNTLCDYHVAIAHRTTLSPIQGPIRAYEHAVEQYVNLLYSPTPQSWRSRHPVLTSLPKRNQDGFLTYGIFPNLHLLAFPNGVIAWIRIDPLTVESCCVTLEIYGIPDFSPTEAQLLDEFEAFMVEDMQITTGVQKGYSSGAYRSGPVNSLEVRISHHQQLLRQFLLPGLDSHV